MIKILNHILEEKSPSQLKKLQLLFDTYGENYEKDLKTFLDKYIPYWMSQGMDFPKVVDSYLNMVQKYIYYQIRFYKNSVYPFEKDLEGTLKKTAILYNDYNDMKTYMAGLSLSLILWKSHYLIMAFFLKNITHYKDAIDKYLEVGVGHGFHFEIACNLLKNDSEKIALDISPVSLSMTESLMKYFHNKIKYETRQEDFLRMDENSLFDFITMGEIVEHVANPEDFFLKTAQVLSSKGKVFFSTCVNCPMIDHFYHFKSIDQIRGMVNSSGLKIISDIVIPSEDLPIEEIVKNKITINYAAIAVKV